MKTTEEVKVLPANVFDALELSALVHGGIGSGCFETDLQEDASGCEIAGSGVPVCIMGHAYFLDGHLATCMDNGPVAKALIKAFDAVVESERGGTVPATVEIFNANDNAVDEALSTALSNEKALITWKQWCKKLNVVRGE